MSNEQFQYNGHTFVNFPKTKVPQDYENARNDIIEKYSSTHESIGMLRKGK